jgi:hypothetical protein
MWKATCLAFDVSQFVYRSLDEEQTMASKRRRLSTESNEFMKNLQIHTIAGLLYPCMYVKRTEGGSDNYDIPMIVLESDKINYTPIERKHSCALCTIILSKDRIQLDKLRTMANGVDLHVFTGADPKAFDDVQGIYVHHVDRLKVQDKMVQLVDAATQLDSLRQFLEHVMQTSSAGNQFGLYDFIDTLKVVLLQIMLEMGYDYVAYQDFSKVLPVNEILLSPQFQELVDRFGIIYGAGYEPEVICFFVSKNAKDATKRTVEELLSIDNSSPLSWGVTGKKYTSRPIHMLRYRAIFGVRLIRTLFHIRDEANALNNAKFWFDTHMFLNMHTDASCSHMLVNSMEDIIFAMKVLSMRCIPSTGMLQSWLGPNNNKNARDMAHMYNYTHCVLMRQWFFWSNNLIPLHTKVYDLLSE